MHIHTSDTPTLASAGPKAHRLELSPFPELEYGDMEAYRRAEREICMLFQMIRDSRDMKVRQLNLKARAIKASFLALDPILARFTGPVCASCPTGCCVNRHGFPDYEDLVVFRALGVERADFDPTLPDQDLCQYLGDRGCMLERYQRSYRCTWFFCDGLLDDFEARDPEAFRLFEEGCSRLAEARNSFLTAYQTLIRSGPDQRGIISMHLTSLHSR